MFFAVGFVLLPTLALTSPMLEELLDYPVDTTGYMTLARGVTLVGVVVPMSLAPARIDNRLLVIGGMAVVVYANSVMLGYRPAMDWRLVVAAMLLQGAGLGTLLPALSKAAFGTLDPKFRPEGTALFNLSRVYGSTIGIAVVQMFFYNNTQAMHFALAKKPHALPHGCSCRWFNHQAGACCAQRHGYPAGGLRRGHRPVQNLDVRHADREPACGFSP